MSEKFFDEYNARMAALEVEQQKDRKRLVAIIADPAKAKPSQILAAYVGIMIADAMGVMGTDDAIYPGAPVSREHALERLGEELDRRLRGET